MLTKSTSLLLKIDVRERKSSGWGACGKGRVEGALLEQQDPLERTLSSVPPVATFHILSAIASSVVLMAAQWPDLRRQQLWKAGGSYSWERVVTLQTLARTACSREANICSAPY